jgi:hypothetical protein
MYRAGGVSFRRSPMRRADVRLKTSHAQHYGYPDGFVDQTTNLTTFAAGDQ